MKTQSWTSLALVALIDALAGEAFATIPAGAVLATQRRVVLERQDEEIPAAPTMALLEKDGVATDTHARAKLSFRDDSILNLGELSRVSVEEYLFNAETDRSKAIYRLVEGTLKVVVGRSDLEIHTPTAVAAARGTAFIVTVRECTEEEAALQETKSDRCTVTAVVVLEGEVETRNVVDQVGGTVAVSKGQTTRVFSSTAPEPAATVTVERLSSLMNSLTVLGQLPGERLPELAGGEAVQAGETATVKASGGNAAVVAAVVASGDAQPAPAETFLEDPEVLVEELQDVAVPVPSQEPVEAVTPVVIRIDLP